MSGGSTVYEVSLADVLAARACDSRAGPDSLNGVCDSRPVACDSRGGVRDSRNGVCDSRNGVCDSRNGVRDTRNGVRDTRGGVCDSRGGGRRSGERRPAGHDFSTVTFTSVGVPSGEVVVPVAVGVARGA